MDWTEDEVYFIVIALLLVIAYVIACVESAKKRSNRKGKKQRK
jgi:hypothetical protein